jgi:hypothetical protein
MSRPTVTFREWFGLPTFRRYRSGGGPLGLLDAEDGCPVATATISPTSPLPEGHVAVKNWSENAGMLEALIAAGIVEDTGRRIPCGYTSAALCRLLVDPRSAS